MTVFQKDQLDFTFSDYRCEIELLWNLHAMVWLKVYREQTFFIQCWAVNRLECATSWTIGSLSYYVIDYHTVIEDKSTGNRIRCAGFFIRPKFSVDTFVSTGKWDPECICRSSDLIESEE